MNNIIVQNISGSVKEKGGKGTSLLKMEVKY
jgi:hypothetical protein